MIKNIEFKIGNYFISPKLEFLVINILLIIYTLSGFINHGLLYIYNTEVSHLASRLPSIELKDDIINILYSFTRTPIYEFIDNIIINPIQYEIASYFVSLVWVLLLFGIIKSISQNSILALTLTIFTTLPLVTYYGDFFYTMLGYNPATVLSFYGLGAYEFSVRQLVGIEFALAMYFFINTRYRLSAIFVLLTTLTHPTTGILIYIIFLIIFFFQNYRNLLQNKIIIFFIIVPLIGPLLMIINYYTFAINYLGIDNAFWYEIMIKDEPDDFSILYTTIFNTRGIITYFLYITTIFFIWLKYYKDYYKNTDILVVFMVTPAFIYLLAGLIEYLGVILDSYYLNTIIIRLQLGSKILNFSFLPSILLGSIFLNDYLRKLKSNIYNYFRNIVFISVILLSGFFLTNAFINGSVLNKINYLQDFHINSRPTFDVLLSKYYGIINQRRNPAIYSIYDIKNNDIITYKDEKNIFKIRKMDKAQLRPKKNIKYLEHYNRIDVYENMFKSIRQNIPVFSGLIIPPYLHSVRDALPNYKIFFQEHHDGNLILGSNIFAKILLDRMNSLLKINYSNMPCKYPNNLQFTYMRNIYNSLNTGDFIRINKKYPDFLYVLTESSNNLDLNVLYKDDYYIIYKIENHN